MINSPLDATHVDAQKGTLWRRDDRGEWWVWNGDLHNYWAAVSDSCANSCYRHLRPITFNVEAETSNAIRGANLELARSIIEDLMAGKGYEAARAFLDGPLAPAPTNLELAPCKGRNCGCTDGYNHSPECEAEYAAVLAGGRFVKE